MRRIEEMDFIDNCLHRMMVVARICVEQGEITKDEIAEYITKKANETFCEIFDMKLSTFGMMCFIDLIKDSTPDELEEMVEEKK